MSLFAASVVDLTLVLSVALLAAAALRRQSAALRHAVLAAALAAGAALPLMESLLPQWPLPAFSWTDGAAADASGLRWATAVPPPAEEAAAPAATSPLTQVSWTAAVIFAWAGGVLLTFGGFLTGLLRLVRLSASCAPVRTGRWHAAASALETSSGMRRGVALLQSTHPSLLVTFGLFRPKIILPADAAAWSDERIRVVLTHEFAHIRRGDWIVQVAAEAVRAIHWFNPLAWLACRRLREESEYACDDAVLNRGIEPTSYATHLLDVARHAVRQPHAWASVPAIAHPSTLERRISAMLTQQRNRAPLTRRAAALAALGALVIAVPTAAVGISAGAAPPIVAGASSADITLTSAPPATAPDPRATLVSPPAAAPRPAAPAAPPAQQPPAAVSGTVYDPSAGVLPGVQLTLTDTQFGVRFTAVTDGAGTFAFREVVPGRYQLDTRLPGFAPVSNVMTLGPGAHVQRSLTLPVGSLEETITVRCSGQAGAPSPRRVDASIRDISGRNWMFGGPAPITVLRRALATSTTLSAQDRAAAPVRVGGQIKAPNQLSNTWPRCPVGLAPTSDSLVVLVARIGVDGYLNEVRAADTPAGSVPPQAEFVNAALDAVRQWHYSPTLLNNRPVEVNVTVTVQFSR